MSNETLQAKFWALLQEENVFYRYEFLMEMENEYKQSSFYRISRMKITDAFNYFMQQMGSTLAAINTLSNADLNKMTENFGLDRLMSNLKEEDRAFLKDLVDTEKLTSDD